MYSWCSSSHQQQQGGKGGDELFCVMRRRRAAGARISYAGVLQTHTACDNYARAAVRVPYLHRRAGSRPQIVAHASKSLGEQREDWQGGTEENSRNERPSTPLISPTSISRDPGTRRGARTSGKDAATLKTFTFGLIIASVCSDC